MQIKKFYKSLTVIINIIMPIGITSYSISAANADNASFTEKFKSYFKRSIPKEENKAINTSSQNNNTESIDSNQNIQESNSSNSNIISVDFENGFSNIIQSVEPCVVSIVTVQEIEKPDFPNLLEDFFKDSPFGFFGFGDDDFGFKKKRKKRQAIAAASGFCVKIDGDKLYIATNYHVVENATQVAVFFQKINTSDGKKIAKQKVIAKVHGIDPKSDLAVLEVDLNDKNINRAAVKTINWGESEKSTIGNWVIAMGNPFGIGFSASQGIISAKGRKLDSFSAIASSQNHLIENCIQHTASINSGNSGGVLVNVKGEVIGVNSAIYSPNGGNVGIGFAIPSETAKLIINSLITHKRTFRGWLGVTIQQLKYEEAKNLGLIPQSVDNSETKPEFFGAYVSSVMPNGPADKAGIKPKDVIIQFNNELIDEQHSLPDLVNNHKIKEKATVSILRKSSTSNNWEAKEIQVDIGDYADFEKNSKNEKSEDPSKDNQNYSKIEALGIIVGDHIDRATNNTQVVVKKLLDGDRANDWFFGFTSAFEVGDIIETANNNSIKDSKQLASIINEFQRNKPNENVTFLVKRPLRNGEIQEILITTNLRKTSDKSPKN